MRSSCKYKDALGKPGQGFHSRRVLGFALYDILATIALGFAVAKLMRMRWGYVKAITVVFVVGVALHWYFCVDTAFSRLLFGPGVGKKANSANHSNNKDALATVF